MHLKQEERGDRGENVGVIAGLFVCEYLCSCRAGGGSELDFSTVSWLLTFFLFSFCETTFSDPCGSFLG